MPGGRNPAAGRLGRDNGRRGRGHRRARRRRGGQRLCQPLRPSRQPLVPDQQGARQGDHLHLSRLELRPRRPFDRGRVRARRQAPGRHAAGVPQGRAPFAAVARRRIVGPRLRHVQRPRGRPRNLSRPARGRRHPARVEPPADDHRPQHAGLAVQLEALRREHQRHLPCLDPARLSDDVPHQPAVAARQHQYRRQRRQPFQPGQARLRRRGRRVQGGGAACRYRPQIARQLRRRVRSTSTAIRSRCRS